MQVNIDRLDLLFDQIAEYADIKQICKRKSVGCCAIAFNSNGEPFLIGLTVNGPVRDFECSNEVGNCGCSHAEPRLIIYLLQEDIKKKIENEPIFLMCTYSPCTNCANIIIESGLFLGVFYDILTEHDKRGEERLRKVMPVFQRKELDASTIKELLHNTKL